ncbi:hypothetical protein, partial [Flavivirga jejuensis]
ERAKQDSIARVKETEKKIQEQQALARKQALEKERAKQDSIAKVKETERKVQELEALVRKQAAEIERIKKDSINKIKEAEKGAPETQDLAKEEEAASIKHRNTCSYLINQYDEFRKERSIRTDPYNVHKDLTIELHRQGRSTSIFFNLSENLGCASYLSNNRSHVKVKLENNQIITFYHSWNVDCRDFSFKGKLSSSQMARLKKSPIKSIRLRGTKSFREITDIDYKTFFIDKLKCIE